MSVIHENVLKTISDDQIEDIVQRALNVPEIDGKRMGFILSAVDAIHGIKHLHALSEVISRVSEPQYLSVEVA